MTWSAKNEPPMPFFDFGPRSWPRPGEDSYFVEVTDLGSSPSRALCVGPFLTEDQAKAWKPGRDQLVTALRRLQAPKEATP